MNYSQPPREDDLALRGHIFEKEGYIGDLVFFSKQEPVAFEERFSFNRRAPTDIWG
jgi:hypothetical protein